MLSHSKKLQFSKVKVFSGDQGACRIILVGSRKKHLQQLAVYVFALIVKYSFVIRTQWIPRDENQIADHLSKFVDFDDWQINPSTFLLLNAKWDPFILASVSFWPLVIIELVARAVSAQLFDKSSGKCVINVIFFTALA